MTGISASIKAEFKKAVSSVVLPVTCVLSAFIPAMLSFMMFVLKNPELSRKLGLVGAKAKLMGVADWPSYFVFLTQAVCGIEIVLFGFIISWVFGREYLDRTVKDLLAIPIPRAVIVVSKMTVAAVWCFAIFILVYIFSIAGGFIVGLPLWDKAAAINTFLKLFIATLGVIYLNATVAFIASATRGYLAAVGFVILSAVFINFTEVIGYGEYYPWSVPMQYAIKGAGLQPGLISWVIVLITGAAGIAATIAWWRYADQDK